jgi:NAD(P)-dependent dehydrogenase (short-subunit alcohol dehydrogenase family)
MAKRPVCVVIGVGPGNGAAFARRFDREGYALALLARGTDFTGKLAAELTEARAFACDAGDPASIASAFAAIRGALGEPGVVVYNAGSGTFGMLEDITPADLESSWRVNTLGLFAVAKEVAPAMQAAGGGSLIITGATASRRGVPRTIAFAQAKAGQRALAESLARHLWPKGIHVAVIIVDGVVDLPRTRQYLKDKPDSFFVAPDDVANTAAFLVSQPRQAWTFELEARPFGESW